MAHSIEVRVPLLDHPLLEYAAALDPALKTSNRINKPLLVGAVDDPLLLKAGAAPKRGFSFPMDRWMKSAGAELEAIAVSGDVLDQQVVGELWAGLSRRTASLVARLGLDRARSCHAAGTAVTATLHRSRGRAARGMAVTAGVSDIVRRARKYQHHVDVGPVHRRDAVPPANHRSRPAASCDSFMTRLFQRIMQDAGKWQSHNTDEYRFPHASHASRFRASVRNALAASLRPAGLAYIGKSPSNDQAECLAHIVTQSRQFDGLYRLLADEESRTLLIALLAYRVLGSRHVKLLRNAPVYRDAIRMIQRDLLR